MGEFNTSLTQMDRSSRQKIKKETQALNDTLDQKYLIDTNRTFHPKTAEYTLFSSAHGTFSRMYHIVGLKSSLGKFKKIGIISSTFSYETRNQLLEKHCKKHKHMKGKLCD